MEKDRKYQHAFVKYTKAGKIVSGSLIIARNYPKDNGTWLEVTESLCCDPDPEACTGNGIKRAYIRFSQGHVVPGSLLLSDMCPPDIGCWKEIPVNLCCIEKNCTTSTTTTTIEPTTTTSSTSTTSTTSSTTSTTSTSSSTTSTTSTSSSTTSTTSSSTTTSSTTTTTTTLACSPSVNVQDFGATGDGVTNDTQAILDAIAYAEANDIFCIYIPTGTYMIDRGFPLKDGFTVYGDGNTSLLRMISGSGTRTNEKTQTSVFVGDNAYSLSGPSSYNSTNNIIIKYLAIDLQKSPTEYNSANFSMFGGIRFINAVSCIIDNVTIINPQKFGVGLYATEFGTTCANNIITNCTIDLQDYWWEDGLGPNDVGPEYITPRATSLIGIELNSFQGPNVNGASLYLTRSNPDYVASKAHSNLLSSNTISGGSHCISLGNVYNNTISNNSISGPSHRGIIASGTTDTNTITDNNITNVGSTGIHFAYGCEGNIVDGNIVNGVLGVEGDGIKSYINCNNTTITNNVISNFYKTGIRVAHGANDNIITGNDIYGNNDAVQVGVKIIANLSNLYGSGLTFSDLLTANNNDCEFNTIGCVPLATLEDDEVFTPAHVSGNVIANNTVTGCV